MSKAKELVEKYSVGEAVPVRRSNTYQKLLDSLKRSVEGDLDFIESIRDEAGDFPEEQKILTRMLKVAEQQNALMKKIKV